MSQEKKDIQEKKEQIKKHAEELYELVRLLNKYKLNTEIRIICNAPREMVKSYTQGCKDINNLLQQFNQLQQNSADIGIIAENFIRASHVEIEQLKAISIYIGAFNNDLKTIKSDLTKVIQPSFLAKLSYALDTKNKPLKYAAWIGGFGIFIVGMAIAITFAILGVYLVAPLVVALVGLISFTIGGLSTTIESSYLGELALNNAEDDPHYKSLITALREQEEHCSKIKEMNYALKKQNEPKETLIEVNSSPLAPPSSPKDYEKKKSKAEETKAKLEKLLNGEGIDLTKAEAIIRLHPEQGAIFEPGYSDSDFYLTYESTGELFVDGTSEEGKAEFERGWQWLQTLMGDTPSARKTPYPNCLVIEIETVLNLTPKEGSSSLSLNIN